MMLDREVSMNSVGLRKKCRYPPAPIRIFRSTRLLNFTLSCLVLQNGAMQNQKAQRLTPSQVSGRFPRRTFCTNIPTGPRGETASARLHRRSPFFSLPGGHCRRQGRQGVVKTGMQCHKSLQLIIFLAAL